MGPTTALDRCLASHQGICLLLLISQSLHVSASDEDFAETFSAVILGAFGGHRGGLVDKTGWGFDLLRRPIFVQATFRVNWGEVMGCAGLALVGREVHISLSRTSTLGISALSNSDGNSCFEGFQGRPSNLQPAAPTSTRKSLQQILYFQ